ncbi:MAG: hypothetical protein AAF441_04570 [Pseudomonadota bacterium]
MFFRIILACVILTSFASRAVAQDANISTIHLKAGGGASFSHSPGDQYRHIVFPFRVPSGTIAIIGVKRTKGSGDVDATVSRHVSSGTYLQAQLSDIVAASPAEPGHKPEILMVPPSGAAAKYYLHAFNATNDPGEWSVKVAHFGVIEEIGAALVLAGLQRGAECLFTDCSKNSGQSGDEVLERALSLGMAVLQSKTICSLGVRALASQVQADIAKEVPDSRFLQYAVVNFISSFGAAVADVSC